MSTPEQDAAAAAEAFLAQLGGSSGGGAEGGGGAKKKKNKKKKGGEGGEKAASVETAGTTATESKKPVSAAARLALERMKKEKEEAERIAREEEEARRKEEEEERARLAAEKADAERKQLKKQKEKERKERLRAEGKAVTKAEKAREAKARAARERLVASGVLKVDEDGCVIEVPKTTPVYQKKKNPQKNKQPDESDSKKSAEQPKQEESTKEEPPTVVGSTNVGPGGSWDDEEVTEQEPVVASWDASDEEWDIDKKLEQIQAKVSDEEEVVEEEDFSVPPPAAPSQAPGKSGGKKKGGKKGKKKDGKKSPRSPHNDGDDESGSDDDESDDESNGHLTGAERVRQKRLEKEAEIEKARERREERMREALKKRTKDELRSPICVVMGHVDTGKTKLLDKIRRTNVQEGEAGGITQQIGATYFPMDGLKKTTDKLNKDLALEYKIPGLLVIDTPGHESFANLRKRGSSTADVAILVIDIMHGLEQQTIESINLLRSKKTPFIVALNKVDRLYGWKAVPGAPIRDSLKEQDDNVLSEFEMRSKQVMVQLMEQGLNAALYYDNKDYRRVVSLVPTSAHSGEGIPDLLLLLVQLTQRMMVERLMFSEELEGTVLDVKKIDGIGTTIDVLLINGKLKRGDTIVVAGMDGPIVTQIRALLTPQPMKEMRVKGEYVHHEEIKAAIGVKIAGQNLEDAIAGTSLLVLTEEDNVEELCEAVMEDVEEIMENVSVSGRGVCVQASTLGSLEALMEFLRTSDIPVASVSIGPVHKRDVSRASIMLEHQKEYACILAFDVKVSREAQEAADDLGVKIFTADIIYHLFDHFTKYLKEVRDERKTEIEAEAVFPSILRILPENVFMKKNPLVFGVEIVDGICKVGTPVVVPDKLVPDDENPGQMKMLELGKIASIEKDGTSTDLVKRGSTVCVKIQGSAAQSYVAYGRHFDHTNLLYSKLTRKSIDLLKENFKEDLQKNDWQLVIKLKTVFDIV